MNEHGTRDDVLDGEGTGWVTAPQLYDGIITSLILCRYTAVRLALGEACPMRHRHPAEDCASLYLQAESISYSGVVDQSLFDVATEIVRRHRAGDDVVGTTG